MGSIFSKRNKNKIPNGEKMKMVLKIDDMSDPKSRRKMMKAVSRIQGIDSLEIAKDKKTLTVVGNVDPIKVVGKLRKLTRTELVSTGPSKVETKEKKDEGKDVKALEEIMRGYYPYPYYWP